MKIVCVPVRFEYLLTWCWWGPECRYMLKCQIAIIEVRNYFLLFSLPQGMEPWDVTLSFWSSSLPASPSIPPLLSTSSTTTCITSTISAFCISFRINISYHWHGLCKSDILKSSGSDSGCTSYYTKDPSKYFEWKYPNEIPHCVVRLSKLSGVSNSTRWWESGCLQKYSTRWGESSCYKYIPHCGWSLIACKIMLRNCSGD